MSGSYPDRALHGPDGRIIYSDGTAGAHQEVDVRNTSKVTSYTKFIVSLVGALLTTVLVVEWGFDLPPWVAGVSALVTSLGVFLAKNSPYVETDTHPLDV